MSGPANIGGGARDEAALAVTLPTDRIWLRRGLLTVRATWRRSEVTDPATHLAREISGLHPVDAEAHFTQGLPALRSNWGFDVFTAWRSTTYYFDEVDTQRLGTWVDVYFTWKPTQDFSLKIEGDNLASHGLEYVRDLYDPFRDAPGGGTLVAIDGRHPQFGPELSIVARKTFG